jgi:hypothetical protein
VLPNAGLRRPTTLIVLPQTFTGTSTGTCITLPLTTPGLALLSLELHPFVFSTKEF